jgi:pimeloyl-ACP methyl ester carboxylesterase
LKRAAPYRLLIVMATSRTQTALRAAGTVAAAGAVAGVYATQRRHARSIASDPAYALLARPSVGRELTFRSADGTLLHAEVFGPDGAPTIVLAHGWTEALFYWIYQILELARDHRVVAYDQRGHNRSGRAAGGDYSLARFGEDVEAVLAAAVPAGERAVLAGHSLGAMSIAAWAESHEVESRVRGAALLNTGVSHLVAEQLLVRYPRFARTFGESVSRRAFLGSRAKLPTISSPVHHAAIRYFAFGPTASPAQVAFYERMLIACPADVRADVGIAIADMNLDDALARLTVPTLVVAGELDRLTPPSHARRIGAALPDLSALLVLPETGHMGPLERPAEVSEALRELARSASSAPVAA